MIPEALLDAIADEGRAITDLCKQLGSSVSINPTDILTRDIVLQPPGIWSPNRHCRLVEASDGWMAVNLAREDERGAVAAWLECDVHQDPWDAVVTLARERTVADLLERSQLLALPVAAVREATPRQSEFPVQVPHSAPQSLSVIDLSALWAGPLCGGLLAEAGMSVTKVEDPGRPDPTRTATPEHDRRLNGRKRRVAMKLGSAQLLEEIAVADILITSARPHALARLGLTPDALFACNPGLIWAAITAYGFHGPAGMRVGFGDDAAAAGGLVGWHAGAPRFLGDALADPLTGLRAAHRALQCKAQGQSGLLDVALAPTAADFAQKAGLR